MMEGRAPLQHRGESGLSDVTIIPDAQIKIIH